MTPEQIHAREKQLLGSWWRRRLLSVPGQMLANPPAYNLPREMLMQADYRVLEIGCAAGSRLLLFDQSVKFRGVSAAGVEPSPALKNQLTALLTYGEPYAGPSDGALIVVSPRFGTVADWFQR